MINLFINLYMRRFLQLKLLIFIVLSISCTNPFSTRTPEEPEIGVGDPGSDVSQTDPTALLEKFSNSFTVQNVSHYQECLSDLDNIGISFFFIPENREFSRLTNWTKQDEINYFNKLINTEDIQEIALDFTNRSDVQIASDTVETQLDYLIDVKFRTKSENYQGRTILKMLRSPASLWYIYAMEDLTINSESESSTWSKLKADYRY